MSVAIFAKAPIPGFAKTRLSPAIGAESAARLQEWLLVRTVETVFRSGLGPVSLWCAPGSGHPFFGALAERYRIRLHDQGGDDLGDRMLGAFRAQTDARPLLLIGTDCPSLEATHLQAAARALELGSDAVFLPAEDGGYVLVGLRRPVPELFRQMPWGSDRVMEETRHRMRRTGMSWSEPATLWDVDRPEDIARLDGDLLAALAASENVPV
ncbi:TIGR04282 family arsenosugar biosynthesis glycosyltransferase [Lutibaculum baratangense]|uniref:Glycosyltransferase n=1 Tax=Lutibaculum baratangense AMV1 TaxID=631454 RepID=V4RN37_9HYPH|nr:TIGR04282 family arsenosugar biosynthesis glycosyltransferase [Lutibaculum baratangense]ESR24635.1 hypothetical protein N177_2315 [Lutibaculum baratangense AMV1]